MKKKRDIIKDYEDYSS